MDIRQKPVNFRSMKINQDLLYCIKAVSGDSENEIISYFYDLGTNLYKDLISRTKLPQRCDRNVKIYYKDTAIAVKFSVWSNYFKWTEHSIDLFMLACFPQNNIITIEGPSVASMVAEVGLGLSENSILDVTKSSEKKYKCMK